MYCMIALVAALTKLVAALVERERGGGDNQWPGVLAGDSVSPAFWRCIHGPAVKIPIKIVYSCINFAQITKSD